jgi:hypothetical protein
MIRGIIRESSELNESAMPRCIYELCLSDHAYFATNSFDPRQLTFGRPGLG